MSHAKNPPRKVIYSMLVSLDGFVAGPNGELDWIVADDELHTFLNDQEREVDTCLFGRRMYEVMSFWDTVDTETGLPEHEREFARIWKDKRKIVFSTSLETVQGNARLAQTDIAAEITNLKEQPGKDIEIAGPTLAATAMEFDQVDEYRLFVQPVTLGSGISFFPNLDRTISLRLVETERFGSGVVYVRYQRADEQ